MPIRDAVIVASVRTPVGRGKPGGVLSGRHPVDLLAAVLSALVERTGVEPGTVDDVIVGCVSQAGQQTFNVARNGVLAAGFPESVPPTTVGRQCGSSQQAPHFAAQGVLAGAYDVVIAAGVESMSRAPMGSLLAAQDFTGRAVAPVDGQRETGVDLDHVNVNGGAITNGHRLGASGAEADRDAVRRARACRRPVRAADDVRGRRDGERLRAGAARVSLRR